jgi:very-short-patch-repair endonuclease
MLVIEVDEEIHTQARQSERDHERTQVLKELGIKELWFSNQEVFGNNEKAINY